MLTQKDYSLNFKLQVVQEIELADKKTITCDMMIDIAEKEYNFPIRTNSLSEQSIITKDATKKSITSSCRLFGYSRQAYYRAIKSKKTELQRAQKVVMLVPEKCLVMPRLGTHNLYDLLKVVLKTLALAEINYSTF